MLATDILHNSLDEFDNRLSKQIPLVITKLWDFESVLDWFWAYQGIMRTQYEM